MKKIANDVYCYDAEWIPCVRTGRLLMGLGDDANDDEVREALWKRAGATAEKPRPFLKLALSRVVSISAVHRHVKRDGSVEIAIKSFPPIADAEVPERVIIGSFLEEVAKARAQLVGYNSQGADLPILVQRGIANRCHCPVFGDRPEKPWLGLDYLQRFSEAHLDLAHVLTAGGGFGPAVMPSLDEIATASLLPGKLDHSGAGVLDLWLNGEYDTLTGYNETDACTTYLLWLRAAWFFGRLTPDQVKAEVLTFRGLLEDLAPRKPHFGRFLEVWDARRRAGSDDDPTGSGERQEACRIHPGRPGRLTRIVAALAPTGASRGAGMCELSVDLGRLDQETADRVKRHLVRDGRRFLLCHVGHDQEGTIVPGRDASGRPLLMQVATADVAALLQAVNTTTIPGVDEWTAPDAA